MLHILNCIRDEKFFDGIMSAFNADTYPVEHKYIIIGAKKDLKHVALSSMVEFVLENEFLNYLQSRTVDAIIIHSLSSLPFYLIKRIPPRIKVVWIAWGYDIYSMPVPYPFVKIKLFHKLTKRLVSSEKKNNLWEKFHRAVSFLKHRKEIEAAIHRVDYFSGVLPPEYDLINKNSFFKAKSIDFNYFPLNSDRTKENISQPYCSSYDILVGNSGDPTNNHLDVYNLLRERGINRKVYSFLSYGGTQKYRDTITDSGHELFGSNFHPITDFLPYSEFESVIQRCGNVIMGHERQQAIGNVNTALWLGCNVFLSDTSVAFNYYKSRGFSVFSIQQDLTKEALDKPLPDSLRVDNRNLILKYFSPEACLEKVKAIYKELEQG